MDASRNAVSVTPVIETITGNAGPTDSYASYPKGHQRKPAAVSSDMPIKGEGGF
jgi:hypothetical protein